jgi:hypothetical protein
VFPGTAATDPATHIASAPRRRAPFNGSLRHGGASEQGPVGRHWDRPASARAWGRTGVGRGGGSGPGGAGEVTGTFQGERQRTTGEQRSYPR